MNTQPIFVGGCYRSGTTLLEKLLHHHPSICIASQPFADFYFYCKSTFLSEKHLKRRYPLDHLFLESDYHTSDVIAFLNEYYLTHEDLEAINNQMARNALGLWTPEILEYFKEVKPGRFLDVYKQLINVIARIYPKDSPRYVGGKEVLCEEYVPYLLENSSKAILIIRDPRAMIASLNFRDRDNLTGNNRPILYSLRAWRKSVAVCLAYEDHPDFLAVSYEDLASAPLPVLNKMAEFLDIKPFQSDWYQHGIRHQNGERWKGNSSFSDQSDVSSKSIKRYSQVLPPEVIAYIEACCWPELKALGFEFIKQKRFDESIISTHKDSFSSIHEKFRPDYSSCDEHVEEEIARFNKLKAVQLLDQPEATNWFVFELAYQKLAAAVKSV